MRRKREYMKQGKKITILGAGNVGATIAYALAIDAIASEIVLIDINKDKAKGEAMDIYQGTSFTRSVSVYDGEYADAKDSDIVVVTVGSARKPGQSRIDLAQGNVNIIKSVMPQVIQYAPHAVYVVVSNPVDILTYAILKVTGLPVNQVIGSGTTLDSSRLRARIADIVGLTPQNVHAYVFGEHGDSAMIPWSLTSIAGMPMTTFCEQVRREQPSFSQEELKGIEDDVRNSGAKVISLKGATYYAIGTTVRYICENILRDSGSLMTVSGLMKGQYGMEDVCLSLPCTVGASGIREFQEPPLTAEETAKLLHSAEVLKSTISSLEI